jgi:hypothetical protein
MSSGTEAERFPHFKPYEERRYNMTKVDRLTWTFLGFAALYLGGHLIHAIANGNF